MLENESEDNCKTIMSLKPQMYYVDVESASGNVCQKVVEDILMLSDYQLISKSEETRYCIFDLDSLLTLSEISDA